MGARVTAQSEGLTTPAGYGPIEPLLQDDSVTEVMVNGPAEVWVERDGVLYRTDVRFAGERELRSLIDRLVAQGGQRVDAASPMVDARLPDGSRVNAVLPPLSLNGPLLTIRKARARSWDLNDLVRMGMLSAPAREFLELAIRAELNVLIGGGAGTGKTTLLGALAAAIPASQRIVTIEDAAELRLRQPHVLRLEARPQDVEGQGEIAVRELVRNALRMRPDRIVVGDVRGAEALELLQAMSTGHDGSLSACHDNSPRDAIERVETMALMAGAEFPLRAVRQQVARALDLLVQTERFGDGARRVTSIAEVQRLDGDTVMLQDIFEYRIDKADLAAGGALAYTGLRPTAVKFERGGVPLPPYMDQGGGAEERVGQRLAATAFVRPSRAEGRRQYTAT